MSRPMSNKVVTRVVRGATDFVENSLWMQDNFLGIVGTNVSTCAKRGARVDARSEGHLPLSSTATTLEVVCDELWLTDLLPMLVWRQRM